MKVLTDKDTPPIQFELFKECHVCKKHEAKKIPNWIFTQTNFWCEPCFIRESVKMFNKLSRLLQTRYKDRRKDKII